MVDLRSRPASRKTPVRKGAAGGAAREGLWHRPALLNLISDVLLLGAAVIIGYALVVWIAHRPSFQLREVVVLTPPAQVSAEQLEYAARSAVKGNFFTVDLAQVRETFEKLPWVRHAQVRRRWPDALELRLEEHQAVAYWTVTGTGDTRLVNRQGEVFVAASNADMPVFSGPEGYAPFLLAQYQRFAETLGPLHDPLREIALSAREAWQLTLDDGLVIRLGRDHKDAPAEARLSRFVEAYPKALAERPLQVAIVDLRYPNGFALLPKEGGHALENGK